MFCDEHGTLDYCPKCLAEARWISVEDRLPLIAFQKVLCFCEGGNIDTGQFYGRTQCEASNFRLGRKSREQYGKHGRWFELAEKGYKVTHWMPLPEPPTVSN